MGHMTLDSGFHGNDFVTGKKTIRVSYKKDGLVHDVLCFKVNSALWDENGTYGRRVWRLITPKIQKAIFFIKYENVLN